MRQSFCGYYAPDDNKIKEMLSQGILVFDANVLLDIFRLSQNNANQVLDIFEKEKDRLWLPYQIAKEYHENLVTVIKKQYQECNQMIKDLSAFSEKFQVNRNQSFLDDKMKIRVDNFSKYMKRSLKQKQSSLKDLIHKNPVKSSISEIFDGKIGEKFTGEMEMSYKATAQERYSKKIPPGYKDSVKTEDKKYGDYFLWRQIIDYAKNHKQDVIFITGDTKEDWFAKEFGEVIGPRPELIEEFSRETEKSYYSYSLTNFLHLYGRIKGGQSNSNYANVINELQENQREEEETENSGYSCLSRLGEIERTENTSNNEVGSI